MTHHRVIRASEENDDTVEVDRLASYAVTVRWADRTILILVVNRRRVRDAVFSHDLTPDELRHAVSVLQRAGAGLERWIIPGLTFLQKTLAGMEAHPAREALKPVVPRLLRSVRSIPLPRTWIQRTLKR